MNTSWEIAIALLIVSIGALGAVPGDMNEDNIVSNDELLKAEDLAKEGNLSAEQLEEIRHIHEDYPRNVEDSLGYNVTVYKPVNSVIAPNSNANELLRSIRAADKIIAISDSIKKDPVFYPELSRLPSIGSTNTPDTEKILSLHPDLVILSAKWSQSQADDLEKAIQESDPSIVVARFDCYRLESYEDEMRKISYLLEKENEANEFLDFYNYWINLIVNRAQSLSEEERPKVYLSYGEFPPFGAYGDSAGTVVRLKMTGGNNIFSNDIIGKENSEIDPEQIIIKNPDIIIRPVTEGGYDVNDPAKMKAIWEKTLNHTSWENINAVKNKKIYIIASKIYNSKYFIGLLYTAKMVHPELFKDLDPKVIHQEYLSRFQNLSINLDEQGIFVYPPLNES